MYQRLFVSGLRRESLEASFDPAGFAPSTGPGAWYAADYRDSQEWIYHFSDEDLAELEAAVLAAQQSGKETKVIRAAALGCSCCSAFERAFCHTPVYRLL